MDLGKVDCRRQGEDPPIIQELGILDAELRHQRYLQTDNIGRGFS